MGGSWSTKRWPPKKFAVLADNLIDFNYKIIILGGPGDVTDAKLVENTMNNQVLNLAGKTNLLQLAGLIDKFSLFISGDTGPMHMAVARNIKTLGIFGPTEV